MWLGLIILVSTAFIVYAWVIRGFFSALIHLVCTVAAGAVAFGVWEPLGHFLLGVSPDRGTMSFIRDASWAIALALPFALTLGILRAATNKLLPANARCDDVVEYVGGGVCGLAAAVITMGIFMLSYGFLRFSPEAMGFQPVRYTSAADGRGSVEREPGIFIDMVPRFDMVTARLYGQMSMTTLRTGEPLGKWYPRFDDVPWANRMTHQGRSRNTVKRKDFDVLGWYTVGKEATDTAWRGGPLRNLMVDKWSETGQVARDIVGEPITNGYIAGFKVRLNAGAKEKQGQIILGNGQVRLVVESVTEEEFKSLHPVAAVTNIAIEGLGADQKPASARFRYDGNDVFFCSIGGSSDANMWLEFAVPSGYAPIGLFIKNIRWEVSEGQAPVNYATPEARDAAIDALGGILAPPSTATGNVGEGIETSNSIGHRIQRGSQGSLEIDRQGRSSVVVNGEHTFTLASLRDSQGVDPSLLIDRFNVTDDTVVVKVDVSLNQKPSILGASADAADPSAPLVVEDVNGQQYEAIGYVYQDGEKVKIRYTPGQPIRGLTELTRSQVMISKSRPDQRLLLVFRPTFGVKLRAFKIGGQTIAEWDPPVELNFRQRSR